MFTELRSKQIPRRKPWWHRTFPVGIEAMVRYSQILDYLFAEEVEDYTTCPVGKIHPRHLEHDASFFMSPEFNELKTRFLARIISYVVTVNNLDGVLEASYCKFLNDSVCGYRDIQTAGYYKKRGYEAIIRFEKPLTLESIKRFNLATHWVNQGFVVILCAYLEYCGVYTPHINKDIDAWYEIDILRRLRNWFAHTSGFYKPNDSEQQKTYKCIIEHFKLKQGDYRESACLFPIPIDAVLGLLVEGCKRHVVELYGRKTDPSLDTLLILIVKLTYESVASISLQIASLVSVTGPSEPQFHEASIYHFVGYI